MGRQLHGPARLPRSRPNGAEVIVGIRPEHITLCDDQDGIPAVVDRAIPYYSEKFTLLEVWLRKRRWRVQVALGEDHCEGDTVYCRLDWTRALFLTRGAARDPLVESDQLLQVLQCLGPDARDLVQVCQARELANLLAIGNDVLGRDRANAGQRFQGFLGCRIDMDTPAAGRRRQLESRAVTSGRCHVDLVTVANNGRQVHR